MKDWDSKTHIDYVRQLVSRGGPESEQYQELHQWSRQFYAASDAGSFNGETLPALREAMSPVLYPETMHGYAYRKPRGYPGDFELIDRHYLSYICPDSRLAKWDRFWHASRASRAVRNRKDYFHNLLQQRCSDRHGKRLNILNIASGSGRDIFEFLSSTNAEVHFDCIDHDQNAIDFASNLCSAFPDRVTFTKSNVVRFHLGKQYDLIWAAGLFDYFNDALFKRVLRRLLGSMEPGGQLVIGNFSPNNPNIAWLRFVEWHLHHRSEGQLRAIAIESGVSADRIRIGQEPEGVNLFLHIHN